MTPQSTDDLILEIRDYISTHRNELDHDDINSLSHVSDLITSNTISSDTATSLFDTIKRRYDTAYIQ